MFICSVTLTKEKLALILAICLIATLLLGIGLSCTKTERHCSHSARRRFLEQYGWQTDDKPFSKETLTLSREWEAADTEYEALQNRQGFSLVPYLGKTLQKYTYKVTNHPECQSQVYANLLLYRGKIVACDILCPDFQNGFIEPVIRENVPINQDVILKKYSNRKGNKL